MCLGPGAMRRCWGGHDNQSFGMTSNEETNRDIENLALLRSIARSVS